MVHFKKLLAVGIWICCSVQIASAATVLCINNSNGSIITRGKKCKANETRFSSSSYLTGINTNSSAIASQAASLAAIPVPANLFIVSSSGAQYSTLQSAITAAIAANPSASNPIVVKVGPGVYDINLTSDFEIPSYVRVQGSGRGSTIFSLSGDSSIELLDETSIDSLSIRTSSSTAVALVDVTGSAEIENIEVASTSANNSTGMRIQGVNITVRLNNVVINMTSDNSPYYNALNVLSGVTARINNLSISISNQASFGLLLTGPTDVLVENSNISVEVIDGSTSAVRVGSAGASGNSFVFKNSSASISVRSGGTGGGDTFFVSTNRSTVIDGSRITSSNTDSNGGLTVDDGGKVVVNNSIITTNASVPTMLAADTNSLIQVGSSKLAGGAVSQGSGTTITCAGVHDENYIFSASTCP